MPGFFVRLIVLTNFSKIYFMGFCNCANTYVISGTVDTCQDSAIKFPFTASEAGEYTLQTSQGVTGITIKKTFTASEIISFPTLGLNENFEYVAKILDPEGEEVTFTENSIEYSCFSFKTSFSILL
jgi:hypothetical protein